MARRVSTSGPFRQGLALALAATVLLHAVPKAGALTREDLYPYSSSGSSVLNADGNGNLLSAEAILKTPVAFYDRLYNSIFVNGNGVLSFARAMQRFFNIAFPLDDPVIAPLYTHVDTRASGTVYWGETEAPEVLARAGGMVRSSFKDMSDFVPSHVFIVTWLDVGYYNERNDKVNTYQAVISSNGTHSFAELLYPENGIQWIQGESHPSGLPDAKAQAGFMCEGRIYTLRGSGTDQIQNLDKWSNIQRPGQWIFQIGPIPDGEDIIHPNNIEATTPWNQVESCRTGATTCHSKATCVDYETGFCCSCKEGFFGNGKSCQPYDIPLRVIGRISGTINGIEISSRDLQCYVQTKDGRTYTALSRIPEEIGASFQLLGNLGGVIGWLFAKPVAGTKNGYELTGGLFNHTAEITFQSTGEKATIHSKYLGLDVFGQLKMEAEISGALPILERDTRLDYGDFDELYTRAQPGVIRSQSERSCKLTTSAAEREHVFSLNQIFSFHECRHAPIDSEQDTTRLKFSRGITNYEATEGIVRFAVNTKMAPLEEEDPCIQGRETCGPHSSCVVDTDSFKCVCNPGYQYLYEEDGSAICVDVNECTAGNDMCSPDAQCVNQEGSHACYCKPGFTGDGRICEKITSCDGSIRCEDFEQCAMIEGAPTCVCVQGYVDTEQGCQPNYTPCSPEDNCSPHAYCVGGSRECVCQPGYVGDGRTCLPETYEGSTDYPPTPICFEKVCTCGQAGWIFRNNSCVEDDGSESGERDLSAWPAPECLENGCICPWGYDYERSAEICVARPGYSHETMGPSGSRLSCNVVNRCDPFAQCVYVAESDDYKCRCNIGYEGDGMECTKTEVSCLEVDTCDPNASCKQTEEQAECVCNPGYEGNGKTCFPIDDCSDSSECRDHEMCTYNPTSSRYECVCEHGHSMVDGRCVVSDCSTNPSQCHVNAQCASTGDGGFRCTCVEGFHGDGVRHCVEDHIGCNVLNNCGRHAVCGYNQTSRNYVCVCEPGYYGDGFTCVPQVSCRRDPQLCSRDATCVPAGEDRYQCVCNDGFAGNGSTCTPRPKHDANFLLVNQDAATLRIPYNPTAADPGKAIFMNPLQMAIALDIDCQTGKVYSSDINGYKIIELNYNGSMVETFVSGVGSPEGLTVDWVSRNLFWTDSGKRTVEVAHLTTKKRKLLFSDDLVNPRGIVVHPYRGKIFWSDWNRKSPKLEWANEDGTGRAIFLQGSAVKLPNSLSIDWSTDELCWADAGTLAITCIYIDSREVNIIAKDLSYPFGLAISPQDYYWTDWKTNKIEVAVKTTGARKPALTVPPGGSGSKLYGIVAVPEICPRVTNVCQYENGRCSSEQLCLPDGQGGRTCACADNAVGPCEDSRVFS